MLMQLRLITKLLIRAWVVAPIQIPPPSQTIQSLPDILSSIASFLLAIVFPIAAIAIIVTGLQFLLSLGNQSKIQGAKRNLQSAVIGALLAFAAYAIVLTIQNILGP